MFYRFSFDEGEHLLRVQVCGQTDRQAIVSRIVRLFNDPRMQADYRVLVDYTAVTSVENPDDSIDPPLSLLAEIPPDKVPLGVAYVLPKSLFDRFDRMPMGVAYVLPKDASRRFLHPILSLQRIKKGLKVAFFRSEAEAMDWLMQLTCASEPVP
jgi:hypothetical protein